MDFKNVDFKFSHMELSLVTLLSHREANERLLEINSQAPGNSSRLKLRNVVHSYLNFVLKLLILDGFS